MRDISTKIYQREALATILQQYKEKGKKIGLTNGAFDILHTGHVLYLQEAKKQCDILVVSINTDSSIKEYKDSGRPIVSQDERAAIVAALESVDFVTFHNERRMKTTLEVLKPDYYIKGGDYAISNLTSSETLKQWGGKPLLLNYRKGKSTTNLIQKILDRYNNLPVSIDLDTKVSATKTVILDRDGVINEEIEYLHEPEKFRFLPGALEGIKCIQDMGYQIVIITNQAGIGLGYFSKEDFYKVNKVMLRGFHDHGIVVAKIYFCPHSLSENCFCRKPKTGLFLRAQEDLHLDFSQCWTIGDKRADIAAGKAAGSRTILVQSGHAGRDKEFPVEPDFVVRDLAEAAHVIETHQ